jgi:hypothetical protein
MQLNPCLFTMPPNNAIFGCLVRWLKLNWKKSIKSKQMCWPRGWILWCEADLQHFQSYYRPSSKAIFFQLSVYLHHTYTRSSLGCSFCHHCTFAFKVEINQGKMGTNSLQNSAWWLPLLGKVVWFWFLGRPTITVILVLGLWRVCFLQTKWSACLD